MTNSGLTLTGGGLTITDAGGGGGTGTVTSVDVSGGTTGLTTSGGPVTSSGTITVGGLLVGANGGTGVANTGKLITLGASLTTTGAGAPTLAFPASSATYTYPGASQTLASLAGTETLSAKTLTTPIIGSVALASLPAAGNAGAIIRCSNFGTKGALLVDDGTRWKPLNGAVFIASLDTTSTTVANSETIKFQYQLPANMWQITDRLRLAVTISKSGTTDTGTLRFRIGTAGTTSDTQIYTGSAIAASNKATSVLTDFRLESATSVQQLGVSAGAQALQGYSNTAAAGVATAVTITSAAANALFFSVSILSSSTNDTVQLVDASLQYLASAN